MSDATFQLVNLVINGLIAIGTVGAVIVALILARKEHTVQAEVVVGIRKVYLDAKPSLIDAGDYVQFEVTNCGLRPIMFMGIHWRTGIFRRSRYVQWFEPEMCMTKLPPLKLMDGESARYMYPLGKFLQENAITTAIAKCPRLYAKSIRVGVSISGSRRRFYAKPESKLLQAMVDRASRRIDAPLQSVTHAA
jgi:hypothetical protein